LDTALLCVKQFQSLVQPGTPPSGSTPIEENLIENGPTSMTNSTVLGSFLSLFFETQKVTVLETS
jgi:hypothetical protein